MSAIIDNTYIVSLALQVFKKQNEGLEKGKWESFVT